MTTAPVNFAGGSSYQTYPSTSTVQISIPKIENNTNTWTSGSLRVELWFTTTPYTGGTIYGDVAATIPYTNVLSPNHYFDPSTMLVHYNAPDGFHTYATLALEEWDGSSYVVEDSINYTSRLPLPTPTPTPAPTPAPTPLPTPPLTLHGSASQYVVANNGASLYIQDSVAGRDGIQGAVVGRQINFTDGVGVFDPSGTAEDVARLYRAILNRAPDVAGLKGWTAAVDNSHVPLSAVANSFAASMEFIQTYGALSNDAFVQKLYLNALGRAADPGGEQAWVSALASGMSRGQVALGFAESPENRLRTLSTAGDKDDAEAYRLYKAALARAPDQQGQLAWSAALSNGATPAQVAQGFIGSPEFQQKYGNLSPSDFVTTLYRNALGREPDAAGLQAWTSALQNGTSKADLVVGFSDSLENRLQTATATHDSWVFIHA